MTDEIEEWRDHLFDRRADGDLEWDPNVHDTDLEERIEAVDGDLDVDPKAVVDDLLAELDQDDPELEEGSA